MLLAVVTGFDVVFQIRAIIRHVSLECFIIVNSLE